MGEVVDRLGRSKEIDAFSAIILNEHSKVISINSSWGTGKSTFIELLIQKIEKEDKAICIKHNAWESDYFDNPLIPLLYEITSYPKLNKKALKTKSTKFSRQYSSGMSAGLNIGATSEVNYSAGVSSQDFDLIDNYKLTKDAVESFKNELGKAQNQLKQPIIIFVDELDRCRPNYAIETLEIIKHFFDIDNITFVIAVDKEQLNNSIKSLYGINAETGGFLRKFIDIELYLPEPKTENWVNYLNEKYLITENTFAFILGENFFSTQKINGKLDISEFFDSLDLSLRDIDKIFLRFKLIIETLNPEKDAILFEYLIFLLTLHQKCNITYEKLKKLDFEVHSDFKNDLDDNQTFKRFSGTGFSHYFSDLNDLKFIYSQHLLRKEEDGYNTTIFSSNFDKYKDISAKKWTQDIVGYMKQVRLYSLYEEKIKYLFKDYFEKIDLINNILEEQ